VSFEQPPGPAGDDLNPATAELDLLESGRARGRRRSYAAAPQVKLGVVASGGLAPAIAAIVERNVRRRPALAMALRAEIELKVEGPYPPTRIVFGDRLVLVEDGPAVAPDLRVEGALTDLVSMMVAPLIGGVPHPMKAGGRAALGKVAFGHLRVEGRIGLMRRLLALMRF
jgi:hypothetical protein